MIITITCIAIIYVFLIASFIYGFEKITTFKLTNLPSKTTFSVIVPSRNEAKNLPKLLESIQALEYPKHLYEIIFVDDDSDDNSAELIKGFLSNARIDIQVISNERKTNSPKKDAITTAIKLAKHEWIITTDADCVVPKYWLDGFDEFIQQTLASCIAAPVTYQTSPSFLSRFQTLDILSLQGATIGSFGVNKPILCNGANFGYKKEVFMHVNGYEGNTNIASGDDIFLLEKMVKHHPKAVHFLKCEQAIVTTSSQPTWSELIAQRIRWAAKTTAYKQWFGKFTGLVVLLMNAFVIVSFLLAIAGVLKAKMLFYIVFIKFNIDVLLLYKTATFFNQNDILRSFFFGFIVYPFFCIYVAFLSLFKGFKWKSRTYKR
ncbi:glycosyl transferase [Yeosuana aromativorans]|uniref:Glycosyl transferase n=1 Tax=Yeosuana aromativorans TaxID=288019 RepID=A0A8J3FHK9_9FLAO|nr:glycosyltransferase [Yeosuana aromativorans]GGK21656.1 glycosyl transferase [Yeosuana aromativorans]